VTSEVHDGATNTEKSTTVVVSNAVIFKTEVSTQGHARGNCILIVLDREGNDCKKISKFKNGERHFLGSTFVRNSVIVCSRCRVASFCKNKMPFCECQHRLVKYFCEHGQNFNLLQEIYRCSDGSVTRVNASSCESLFGLASLWEVQYREVKAS
jgi:hypothetical protein